MCCAVCVCKLVIIVCMRGGVQTCILECSQIAILDYKVLPCIGTSVYTMYVYGA